MARKRHTPEQIIRKLREAEVELAKGLTTADVVLKFEITEQTYYRRRKGYGGLRFDQAKRLKELEKENARQKKLVADQALLQFHYIATVTREPFRTTGRIGQLIENGWLFQPPVVGDRALNPETDRIMLCGSNAMIKDFAHMLEGHGFTEGSNANPGSFVLERAFVG